MEEENKRLKARLEGGGDLVSTTQDAIPYREDLSRDYDDVYENSSVLSEPQVIQAEAHETLVTDNEGTYHGTTSTLFNAEAEPSRPLLAGHVTARKRSMTSMQNNLIAAATRQRKLQKRQ